MLGERFGRLVVVESAEKTPSGHKRWKCQCDCGNTTVTSQQNLRSGHSNSCGCYKKERIGEFWGERREPSFWDRIEKRGEDDCWEWTGPRKERTSRQMPYGYLGWKGKITSPHRVAYELTNGLIPKGAFVLHRCDNHICCNPKHLYLGDHARNMQDMVERGRRKEINAGEKNGRAKLTQEQADEIRTLYAAGGRSQQSIADEYGVSQNAVSKIVNGQRYA